jgi:hypothetical protein
LGIVDWRFTETPYSSIFETAITSKARLRVSTSFSRLAQKRFSGDPSFARSRRSMSLTEIRRLD